MFLRFCPTNIFLCPIYVGRLTPESCDFILKTISVSNWMNSIQVSFTLYILLGIFVFSAIPGFIVSHIEGWDFITTAYFTVITLFSIGFGDVVPSNDYERFVFNKGSQD